jgi:hypothetical protein
LILGLVGSLPIACGGLHLFFGLELATANYRLDLHF